MPANTKRSVEKSMRRISPASVAACDCATTP